LPSPMKAILRVMASSPECFGGRVSRSTALSPAPVDGF